MATVASNAGAQVVTPALVTIGNAGNPANPVTGLGSVSGTFSMSRTETTNADYVAFLNKVDLNGTNPFGLYVSFMGSTVNGGILFNSGAASGSKYSVKEGAPAGTPVGTAYASMPVNYVSWFSAARFVNWLNNGQNTGTSTINTGAYVLSSATSGSIVARQPGATYFLPSNNEWYKAAFYNATSGTYTRFPTNSDTQPLNTLVLTGSNSANWGNTATPTTAPINVNAYVNTTSAYGLYSMFGNVLEMTDTAPTAGQYRVFGGNYNTTQANVDAGNWTSSYAGIGVSTTSLNGGYGFRVASSLTGLNTTELTWYGDGVNPGGSGTWTTTGINWFDGTTVRTWVPGAKAIFTGSAGTVTLGAGISVNGGLQFASTGFTLTGTGLTLGGTANAISVAAATTAKITAPLAGTAGFSQSGAGTLALAGANTISGAAVVDGGRLEVGDGGTTGIIGSGSVVNNAELVFNRTDAYGGPVANVISGSGGVTLGSGALTLSGGNSYAGGTIVRGGTLALAAGGAISHEAADIVVGGGTGTLNVTGGSVTNSAGILGSDAGSIGTATVSSGTWANNGNLTVGVLGTGTLTMTGGLVTVGGTAGTGMLTLASGSGSGGTLNLGTGGLVGTLQTGTVAGGAGTAAVVFNHTSSSYVFAPQLTGTLSVTQSGNGTTALTGSNTYTGMTTISSGMLQVGSGGTTGIIGSGSVVNNATLVFNRSDDYGGPGSPNVTRSITGSGTVQLLAGSLTLSGSSSYSGGTVVRGGTLALAPTGVIAHGTANVVVGRLSGDIGALSLGAGTLTGSNGILGNDSGASGVASVSGSGAWTSNGSLTVGSLGTGTLSIADTGLVRVGGTAGNGTLTLASGSGSRGTLNLGTGGLVGTLQTGTVAGGAGTAAVVFNHTSGSYAFAPRLTGTLSVTQAGPGLTILTGTNDYVGTTTISSGTLQVGNSGTTGSLAAGMSPVVNNSALVFSRADAYGGALANVISGSGGVTLRSGALTLSGSNSYAGGTVIRGGTLALAAGGAISHSATNVVVGDVTGDVGALSLSAGSLTGSNGILGNDSGASGVASVSGSGAWTSVGSLTVGNLGSGTLALTGGAVTIAGGAGPLTLAAGAGSRGTLNIGTGGVPGTLHAGTVAGGSGTAAVVFNHTSESYAFAPRLTGTLSVTHSGSGRTLLSGSNAYIGPTTVQAGTLQFANRAALYGGGTANWTAANLTVQSWATLAINVGGAGEFTAADVDVLDTIGVDSIGFLANSRLGLDTSNAVGGTFLYAGTMANPVSGAALGLTKLGSGTLSLTGANSYTGGTVVRSGELRIAGGAITHALTNVVVGSVNGDAGVLSLPAGTITSWSGVLGNDAGATGAASVTGSGTWTINNALGVGFLGTGTLSIAEAGMVRVGGTAGNGTILIASGSASRGTLNLGSGGLPGTLQAGLITGGSGAAAVVFNHTSPSYAFAPRLTGTLSVTHAGPGLTLLSASNTYVGTTTVSTGTLQFMNRAALYSGGTSNWTAANLVTGSGATLALSVGGTDGFTAADIGIVAGLGTATGGFRPGSTLGIDTSSGFFTYSGTLANPNGGANQLGLTKLGDSTLALTGPNTYTGATTISRGYITIGNGGTTGVIGSGPVVNNGVLYFNRSDDYGGPSSANSTRSITGSGLVFVERGSLTLSGSNSYTGYTWIAGGTLALAPGGSINHPSGEVLVGSSLFGSARLSLPAGTLTGSMGYLGRDTGAVGVASVSGSGAWTNNGSLTVGLQGTGTLSVADTGLVRVGGTAGNGTLALASGSGSRGTLNLGTGSAPGTLQTGTVTGGAGTAVVNFNHTSGSYAFAPRLTGSLSVNHVGPGLTILTGANTYTGTTTITSGTLQVGAGGTTGSIGSGAVVNNGRLIFNRSDFSTYAGVLSGTGTLVKLGAGVLNLTGTTAATNTVVLDFTTDVSAGSLQASGGIYDLRIGNSGTGVLNVNGGQVSNGVGYLGYNAGSTGTATISSGTWANSRFLAVGHSGAGTLNVTGGSVTISFGYLGSIAGSHGTATVSSGTWANSGFLFVGQEGTGTLNVTGGSVIMERGLLGSEAGSRGTATVSGGTWANSGNLTVGLSGTGTLTMTGGLVTVGGTLSTGTFGTINLNPGGTLQIGTGGTTGVLNTNLTNNGTLIFNRSDDYGGPSSANATRSITGSGGVTLLSGALGLSGSNTYAGGTVIRGGTLALAAGGAINHGAANVVVGSVAGDVAALSLPAGTLTGSNGMLGSGSAATGVALVSNSGAWTNNGSLTVGSLGTGTLSLADTGLVRVGGTAGNGTLTLASGSGSRGTLNLGTGGLPGTLQTGTVAGGAGTAAVVFNHTSGSYAFAPRLTGTLSVTQAGPGLTMLTGANDYVGTTTISSGTLQVGNSGTTGSLPAGTAPVVNDAALIFNRTDAYGGQLANVISGSGRVTLRSGTLALSGNNSYTGGTTISAGVLQVGAGGTTGVIGSGTVSNNSLLIFNRTDAYGGPFANVISGSGGVTLLSGTLALSGSNSYTGATTISSGALQVGNFGTTGVIGSGPVSNNGLLVFNRTDDYGGPSSANVTRAITGSGSMQLLAGSLTLSGSNSYSGGTMIRGGTLSLAPTGVIAHGTANVTVGSLGGDVGALSLSAGTLTGSNGILGNGSGAVGRAAVSGSGAWTSNGSLTVGSLGTGTLTIVDAAVVRVGGIAGTGTLSLASSAGSRGTLNIGTGTIAGTLNAAAIAAGSGSAAVVFNHVSGSYVFAPRITGTLAVTHAGPGRTILTGSNSYGGSTTISSGTLQFANREALFYTTGSLVTGSGATLALSVGGTANEFTAEDVDLVESIGPAANGFLPGANLGLDTTTAVGGTFAYAYGIANANAGAYRLGLAKLGEGTLLLSGSSSYTGPTTVTAGILRIGTGTAGSISGSSSVIVNAGATLAFGRTDSYGGPVANVISGSGGVTLLSGSLALSGSSSYAGGTTIRAGRMTVAAAGAVNHGQANVVVGQSAGDSSELVVAGGSIINLDGSIGSGAGSVGTATVSSGTWVNTGNLAVGTNGTGTLNVSGGLVAVAGALTKGPSGMITLSGGTLQFGSLQGVDALSNNGTLIFNHSAVSTHAGLITGTGFVRNGGTGVTTLTGQTSFTNGLGATAGRLVAGDSAAVNGFATTGGLAVAAGATLELRSKGLASVNGLSTLVGGTIRAANGMSLGAAANVVGAGTISGFVSAVQGSRIEADGGKLTVGDAGSFIGFSSDGLLYTNANEVELLDRNVAVLGSLTQLGNGASGGSLRAANGMLLEQGKNLVGRGTVYGNFVNQGDVYGDGAAAGQQLVFAAGSTVSGNGSFANVLFNGTYAPGNSPAVTSLRDGMFAPSSTLVIELGGTQVGSQYDQVQDGGTLSLLGGSLDVVLTNSFKPTVGDSFQILRFGQLVGDFGTVSVPAFDNGLGWQRVTTGSSMTLSVIRSPVSIDVASGSETLAAAGYASLTYATSLEKTGTGTLILDDTGPFTGTTAVTQGVLQLGNADALSSSTVTVAAGASLAVGPQVAAVVPGLVNNGLVNVGLGGLTVTTGQTAAGIVAQIVAGRNDGAWDGATGITSSAAAAMSDRAVGWIDNGDGSFTVGFGAAGDWNLNGVVDFDDVLQFVSAGLYDTGLLATWAEGDYDYNGVVDFDDVLASVSAGLFDTGSYNVAPGGLSLSGLGSDPGLMAGGFAAVPEPSTWMMGVGGLACAAWGAWRRRR